MAQKAFKKRQFYKDEPGRLKQELKWLGSRMKTHRRAIAGILLLGMLGTVMSLISGIVTKYLIDAVTVKRLDTLVKAAVVMAVLTASGVLLQSWAARYSALTHVRVRNQLQQELYSRLMNADWQSIEHYQSGDLLSRLNGDVSAVSEGLIGFVPGVLIAAVKLLGALGIILYFDPVMALIVLAGTPVTLILSRLLLRKLHKLDLSIKELNGQVMAFQEDSLRNLTSIKAFGASAAYEREMTRLHETYRDKFHSYADFRIAVTTCLSLAGMAVTAASLCWGVYRLWIGAITYGSLVLFLQLASVLRGGFSALTSSMQQAVNIGTSAERVMELEQMPIEESAVPEGFREEQNFEIRLNRLKFEYQAGGVILNDFDFYAMPGEMIAVTGQSGAGKTTLLRLLLGLIKPQAGQAILKGANGSYPISGGTRSAFAYVPQGSSIFAGTVAHNLRIVAEDATDDELCNALKTACAWSFVEQLGGLNYELGSGGSGISEGQAQRLAIARALLCKAPILLLDEATSGLDAETEEKLLRNLQESNLIKTCVLVTHRETTAKICTRTYHLGK